MHAAAVWLTLHKLAEVSSRAMPTPTHKPSTKIMEARAFTITCARRLYLHRITSLVIS